MAEPRLITLEELKAELRDCGYARMGRLIGYSRQHVQRVATGKRKPSVRFLAKLSYIPVTLYKDIMPKNGQ